MHHVRKKKIGNHQVLIPESLFIKQDELIQKMGEKKKLVTIPEDRGLQEPELPMKVELKIDISKDEVELDDFEIVQEYKKTSSFFDKINLFF